MNSPKRTYALLAGISLILMAVLAGFAFGFVYSSLVFPEESQKTLTAIQNSIGTYKAGIMAWLGILILDILVAWALHLFLKEVNFHLSFITAAIRIFYAALLGVAIYHQVAALSLIAEESSAGQVLYELQAFETIWSVGLIFFGLHLIGLGVLCWKAPFVPTFWGGLLTFAGSCYTLIHLAKALFPAHLLQIAFIEQILSLPMAFAEIGLAVSLIWKGGKINSENLTLSP